MYTEKEMEIFSGLSGIDPENLNRYKFSFLVTQCFKKLYEENGFNICTKTNSSSTNIKIKGGYVMFPIKGKHRNVLVLDMDSMYPSVIIAFNLGPETTNIMNGPCDLDCKSKNVVQVDYNTYVVSKKEPIGPLAHALQIILKKRKDTNNPLEKKAFKKLSNSAYGLACRGNPLFGGKIVASAITQYSRLIIQTLEKEANNLGFTVLYGDTDALFLTGSEFPRNLPNKLLQSLGNYRQFFNLKVEHHFKYFEQYKRKQYYGITVDDKIVSKGNFRNEFENQIKVMVTLNFDMIGRLCFENFKKHKFFKSLEYFSQTHNCKHIIRHKLLCENNAMFIDPPIYLSKTNFCIANNQSIMHALLLFLSFCGAEKSSIKQILRLVKAENNFFIIEIKNFLSIKVHDLCYW